ncbi:MAG: hypothetical protein QW802_01335 [Candidatus Altiarchaeota archaeon]
MEIKKKKGQGAMEYLMTYGWAILVVMIVGVVLWQLGIFGPSSTVNTCRGFSKVKVFDNSIRFAPAIETDNFKFTIMNGAGQTITGTNISIGGCDCITCTDLQIGAGDTYAVTASCSPAKAPGESFSIPINITYVETVVGTPVVRVETGTCRGSAEKA